MIARRLAIAGLALALIAGAGALAAPTVARVVAESKVDKALKRIRRDNTAVANRGAVEVDLWSRTVRVKDISIDGPGGISKMSIGRLTIARPAVDDDRLTADSVVIDDVTILSAGEKSVIPRLEITNYSGPDRGLTTTPGVGAFARSQADVIAKVSFDRATAPQIVTTNDDTRVRRTIRNVAVHEVVSGVVKSASVDKVAVEAPYLAPDEAPSASAVSVSFGRISYEEISLPTLWRFYAGDGAGDPEPLVKSIVAVDLEAGVTLRPSGRIAASVERVAVENVKARSLGYSLSLLDPMAVRARLGQSPTPADIRQQLLLAIDAARAVKIDRVAVSGVRAEAEFEGAPARTASLGLAEIVGYADARLQSARVEKLALDLVDDARFAVDGAEASALDATGLAGHLERIGRNEILLSTAPTLEDMVRIAPRLARIDAAGLSARTARGSIEAASARIDVDAPLDAVPQKIAVKLDGLEAAPPAQSPAAAMLKTVELEELNGSAAFTLVLDPNDKTLVLENLDYRFADLGVVQARGEIAAVDPAMALESGAAFIDKLLKLKLGSFKLTARDDGAVGALLRRAAATKGVEPALFRETFARQTQEMIFRVFGPTAENSAESAADFIRDPRSIEVTVTPKTTDQSLIEFIDAFDLGPEGVAQTIDVAILNRR